MISPDQTSSESTSITTVLRSGDFSCPSCVAKIEKRLLRVNGVRAATVHFAGRIEVERDTRVVTVQDLVEAVAKVGYRATPASF